MTRAAKPLRSPVFDALTAAGTLPAGLDRRNVTVEPPRDPAHGDLATNAAMVLAKPAGSISCIGSNRY